MKEDNKEKEETFIIVTEKIGYSQVKIYFLFKDEKKNTSFVVKL